MKKILMASTMLVATAGMAAADITFDGFGRFGIVYNDGADDDGDRSDTQLDQRFRLNVVGTTETDGGVEFRARLRLESNDNGDGQGSGGGNVVEAPEFGVRAGGFNVFLGNTSDLIDSGDVVDYYGNGIGLTDFAETSSNFVTGDVISGINGGDDIDPTIKTSYTVGDFTFGASYSDNALDSATEEYQIGLGYKFGNYGVGAAFGNVDGGDFDDTDFWALSFNGDLGSFAFSLLAADSDDQDDVALGASIAVPVGAATDVRFVVSDNGLDSSDSFAATKGDDTAYAIGFRHSLGGGVRLQGGIGENSLGDTVGDLGVIFNF
ncbi:MULTISPECIES: porin [Roseobacter]|uniref:Porin-like protein n=1 Tax=Roseobacter litoralis (strain ATCC 49566 / DSM 6996 / JCM 21268 / NBRC 15278 / OCh 149) TaxID=391595 RepID=F7ZDQ3_ROSLO|nr:MULTISPECIES: porin [Roseobacter]AEI95838.1 porin-like protein [Roseobacter litoralis Och 149]GIT88232.1 hypothetical protein ROBYS_32480 [Roseobacter sp. OBYS 0001]